MTRRLLAIGVVALIVALAGANVVQWKLRARRPPVQELPPYPDEVRASHLPDRSGGGPARSLIVVIGDGMGINHVRAASLRRGGRGGLEVESMPVTGLMLTHSATHLVPDSAAAATALSTGTATRNGAVGVDVEGRPLRHLMERAAAAGKATGIVTTDDATGATPAAFSVHVAHRDRREEIARALLGAPLDVLIGGGRGRIERAGLLSEGGPEGWRLARSLDEAREAEPGRLLALPTAGPLGDGEEGRDLAAWALLAMRRLETDPDGFVLLVEDTHIDRRSHDNRAVEATDRIRILDHAVQALLAAMPPDTLVVVTADHETGGLAVGEMEGKRGTPAAAWGTRGHTAAPVAIFAEGPGAERFTGVLHAPTVGERLREALGLGE